MANKLVLLHRIELNTSAASVTFANIPQTGYTDLKVLMSTRGTNVSFIVGLNVFFNSNFTSGDYTTRRIYGSGSGIGVDTGNVFSVLATASTATTNTFGNTEIYIPEYALSGRSKTVSIEGVTENNATDAYQILSTRKWSGTSPITSITFQDLYESGQFVAGSTFSLYGIAATGTAPVLAKAYGGDVIVSDGTYWYHAFKSSGTFAVKESLTCSVLQVAGGGAGFYGGGGAGGLLYTSSQAFSAQDYAVTIGAGGAAPNPYTGNIPVNGNNSTVSGTGFTTLSAIGGGGGGVYPTLPQGANGANGGSGGGAGVGASGSTHTGGSPTSGQGFRGGNSNSTNSASGGGGAGAAGTDMSSQSNSGTNGGAGTNTYSSWATATNTGVSGYYAGGGGGRGFDGRGVGGAGGGGSGDRANSSQGSAGTANTGGGGGGGYGYQFNGYKGGSGIVIIRYAV